MNAMVSSIIIPLPTGTSVPCRDNTKESKRRIYVNRPGKLCHYKFLHLNEIFLLSHHIVHFTVDGKLWRFFLLSHWFFHQLAHVGHYR